MVRNGNEKKVRVDLQNVECESFRESNRTKWKSKNCRYIIKFECGNVIAFVSYKSNVIEEI